MPNPNNVTRMLDAKKVVYQAFELPPEKLGALETSRLLAVPPEQVFKTIVVVREKPGKPILAVIPGSCTLDPKALAAVLGEKKVQVPTQHTAEQITGLQAGGISPLALINKGFNIWIDNSAKNFAAIHVSGGQRGLNIRLAPDVLAELVHAHFAAIATPTTEPGED